MKKEFKYIIFDADDTLWMNETLFRETEGKLCELLKEYAGSEEVMRTLYQLEMKNLEYYGFGIKGFMLSMLETALQVSHGTVGASCIETILALGKAQLSHPVELLPEVKNTLRELKRYYPLVLATKGDLLDQERKVRLSGLKDLFCHIEIMSDKNDEAYQHLFKSIGAKPEEILMVGNSMKSDILPILKLGGSAVYIPFHTTWVHEMVAEDVEHDNLVELESIGQLKQLLL